MQIYIQLEIVQSNLFVDLKSKNTDYNIHHKKIVEWKDSKLDKLLLNNNKWNRVIKLKYVNSLIIKFLMTFAILFVFLSMFNNVSVFHIFMLSLIITSLGFILGDLIILRFSENWLATITDFLLVVIAIRVYSSVFFMETLPSLSTVGLIALIVAAGEVFFHTYVDRNILNITETVDSRDQINTMDLQTEFAEEFDTKEEE